MMRLYCAGPMRGLPEYNYPAFRELKAQLLMMGHLPISPVDRDKESGFNEKTDIPTQDFMRKALEWDLQQVCRSDGVVVLPGWRKSLGARAEVATARAVGLPVYILIRGATYHLRECHYV